MDSNGPAGRLRGTPQQIFDRYSALARDASSSGDMVLAENLWQHAEHYARLLNLSAPPQQNTHQNQRYGNGRDDSYDNDDQDDNAEGAEAEPRPQQRPAAAQPSQPDTPEPVTEAAEPPRNSTDWTPADVQTATDEVVQQSEAEQRPTPPRRRRRTRFQRQQDADQAAAGHDGNGADGNSAPESTRTAAPLALPEDRSPGALIELLTQAETGHHNGSADKDDDNRRD